ncbi:molybdopterin-binding/glycosyltransferase family 2 protein [Chelativorans sp. Marseille-P2723]|uniref:NTP transferase domain-containing protein n=1 Tax=Chelativorans sp. Marseille-P2723 TaxID=2709133 RepID=UPI00156E84FE|nr:molybdopterin-binding/glycosyltransferase family 2 protein [Chelativorans sp. Marseille-P2723]
MKFGPVAVEEAKGAILAHAMVAEDLRLRKAHRLTAEDVEALARAGIREVVAAVLDPDDLDENLAADRVARALRTVHVETRAPSTGRVNLHATEAGIFMVEPRVIDAINRIDPAITIATLAPYARVEAGQMVATVKIIPFAVPENLIAQAETACRAMEAFSVQPFLPRRIALVQTVLPGVKMSVLDKTTRMTKARLSRSGSRIVAELRPPHREEAVAEAIRSQAADADMLLIFGVSAVCDEDDVIPAAIRRAGGKVLRVGMPVDPGNLLVLGTFDGKTVMGVPGCARSPKLNGFDWVLDRLVAGLDVTPEEIGGMGVGGLLMEIPTRPQPRETLSRNMSPKVWAVLLAAGQSRRMAPANKLLVEFEGKPLVRRTAERLLDCAVAATVVVLGHEAAAVSRALSGLSLRKAENADYASGLASSLKVGVRNVPPSADGVLIALSDMPGISTADLDLLIKTFVEAGGKAVVRATHNGKRGNPVILPRVLFSEIEQLEGDVGARQIIEASALEVIDVEIGCAASFDVDTPEALELARGALVGQE